MHRYDRGTRAHAGRSFGSRLLYGAFAKVTALKAACAAALVSMVLFAPVFCSNGYELEPDGGPEVTRCSGLLLVPLNWLVAVVATSVVFAGVYWLMSKREAQLRAWLARHTLRRKGAHRGRLGWLTPPRLMRVGLWLTFPVCAYWAYAIYSLSRWPDGRPPAMELWRFWLFLFGPAIAVVAVTLFLIRRRNYVPKPLVTTIVLLVIWGVVVSLVGGSALLLPAVILAASMFWESWARRKRDCSKEGEAPPQPASSA
ncbi:MAG TPA: hypothetical protein VGW38_20820 [Chloroflexota bacterium]|nr:hypothetical protein [Chloroflexota bacterium]